MGTSGAPKGEAPVASFNRVSPGFFQTLQTALQASLQTTAKVLNLSLMDFLG